MALKDDDPFSQPDYLSEHLFRSYSPHSKKPTLFDQLRTIEKEKQRLLKRYAELDQSANKLIDDKT